MTGFDGQLWRYDSGVYRGDGQDFARTMVRELLGDQFRRAYSDEAIAWLRSFEPTITDRPPERWVNVANGLLDWHTGELHPHTPDVISTVQIPVAWDPDAACPLIDRFLAEVLPASVAELMYELAGYLLYPGNPLRRAWLLLGPGRNGKSVLLNVLRDLAGPRNVASVPLQALAENRFASAALFGKLANIAGDLDARAIHQTDTFKMATGGDPISAERKYGRSFTFTPFATFVFAANEPPISSDQSVAWFDRWIIVPFERRVPEHQIDPHLTAKLTTPDQLTGLLAHAIPALRHVMAHGFTIPEPVGHANAAYRDRLDTARGFVTECCAIRPDTWTPRPDLYRAYQTWAKESGRLPVSAETFNDHLRRNWPDQIAETTRRGTRGWTGITLIATDRTEP